MFEKGDAVEVKIKGRWKKATFGYWNTYPLFFNLVFLEDGTEAKVSTLHLRKPRNVRP